MDEQLLEAASRNYERIAPELVKPVVQFLSVTREIGGGDIDKLLIMLVVGLRTIAHPAFKGRRLMDVMREAPLAPTLGINSRSLAETLPIPRETVRRKVRELMAAGWLVRSGYNLHYTLAAAEALTPFRRAMLRAAVAQHGVLARLEAGEA